jgi:hypothetical protein
MRREARLGGRQGSKAVHDWDRGSLPRAYTLSALHTGPARKHCGGMTGQ